MSQFKPYPAYKDSGVEWLGEVPEHWRIGSFRHLIISVSNGTTADQVDEAENTIAVSRIETISSGSINFEKTGYVSISNAPDRFLLNPGDILFSHINSLPMVGNVAVYSGEKPLLHGMNLLRIQPRPDVSSEWVLYWLKSKNIRQEVESRAKPAINQASVSTDSVRALPALIPSKPEQTQIARFLDYETARIDALIEEQKHLIELLKEKRQAVISHAVTKGLDPTVPMKDSGVEWLGEVPAHWNIGSLRWYASIQGGIAKGKDYKGLQTISVPYLRVANVQSGHVDLSEVKEIEVLESEVERYSLRAGDVLMNEGGDNDKLGRGTVWQAQIEPCLHQNHVFAIRPNELVKAEWLTTFTQSDQARAYFFLNSKQSTNLASISASNLMGLVLPLPPESEQQAILSYLNNDQQQHDELTTVAIKTVELLHERRSALISEAVTGKIDVSDWQPPTDNSAPSAAAQKTCLEAV